MKQINIFFSFLFISLLIISSSLIAQDIPVDTVCSGAEEYYKVLKTEGSTYAWSVSDGGTASYGLEEKADSVVINWDNTNVLVEASLQVVETNKYGYVGDPVRLKIMIYPIPTATISGSDTLLDGNNGTNRISVDFTGTSPFTIIYNDGKRDVTVDNIDTNPYTLQSRPLSFPPDEHIFTLVDIINESGCSGQVSGSATIIVAPPVNTSAIMHN